MQTDWPILILTLEGDEARRRPLLDRLTEMNLSWHLIFGVDGRQGLSEEHLSMIDRQLAQSRLRRPMTSTEFACALSHRSIYDFILEEGLLGAVVLEDDAILTPDFPDFIQERRHYVESLVLLDYESGRAAPWHRKRIGRWRMYRPARRASLNTAYSVSRKSAYELLRASTPVSSVADWPIDLFEHKAWLVSPRVVHHSPEGQGPSHIADERAAAEMQLTRERKKLSRVFRASYYRGFLRRKLARRMDS